MDEFPLGPFGPSSAVSTSFADAKLRAAIAQVADLAKIPADRRERFCTMIAGYHAACTEHNRLFLRGLWGELSESEKAAVEDLRGKVLSACNAAHALSPNAILYVTLASHPYGLLARLKELVFALNYATEAPGEYEYDANEPKKGRGRPAGRGREAEGAAKLVWLVEGHRGHLPSIDHDPDGSTINKIIKILQPHFPKGDLRPISAATFRRIKREILPFPKPPKSAGPRTVRKSD